MVSDTVQYNKRYDSGLELPEINCELRNAVQKLRSPEAKLKSWTNEWMVRRIQDQPTPIAIRDLKTFTVGNKTVAMFGQVGKVSHCWQPENGKK